MLKNIVNTSHCHADAFGTTLDMATDPGKNVKRVRMITKLACRSPQPSGLVPENDYGCSSQKCRSLGRRATDRPHETPGKEDQQHTCTSIYSAHPRRSRMDTATDRMAQSKGTADRSRSPSVGFRAEVARSTCSASRTDPPIRIKTPIAYHRNSLYRSELFFLQLL